jgi:hypothetical protein
MSASGPILPPNDIVILLESSGTLGVGCWQPSAIDKLLIGTLLGPKYTQTVVDESEDRMSSQF